jgi:hypothetical protein
VRLNVERQRNGRKPRETRARGRGIQRKAKSRAVVPAKPAINTCSYVFPMTLSHGPHFPQENGGRCRLCCTINYPGKTQGAPWKHFQLYLNLIFPLDNPKDKKYRTTLASVDSPCIQTFGALALARVRIHFIPQTLLAPRAEPTPAGGACSAMVIS